MVPAVRSMLRFGFGTTLNGFVSYFANNVDKLLLGRIWGTEAVGLYGRAFHLINFPGDNLNSTIGEVAFAALSRTKDDLDRFRRYFLKGIFPRRHADAASDGLCARSSPTIWSSWFWDQNGRPPPRSSGFSRRRSWCLRSPIRSAGCLIRSADQARSLHCVVVCAAHGRGRSGRDTVRAPWRCCGLFHRDGDQGDPGHCLGAARYGRSRSRNSCGADASAGRERRRGRWSQLQCTPCAARRCRPCCGSRWILVRSERSMSQHCSLIAGQQALNLYLDLFRPPKAAPSKQQWTSQPLERRDIALNLADVVKT